MTKEKAYRWVTEIAIVPVVRAQSPSQAIRAAEAVCAGGIPIVEVTRTVPGAVEAIAQLVKSMGKDMLVGAGTVLDVDMARRCLDAGAEFLVSPGFDLETVRLAHRESILMMAGALSPTEVIAAWKSGSDFVKIFPCGNVGGPNYIKALKGPLPQVPMIPTGGVNLRTAGEFIKAGAAALGIGGELVSRAALESGHVAKITAAAKQYLAIVREARQSDEATVATRGGE